MHFIPWIALFFVAVSILLAATLFNRKQIARMIWAFSIVLIVEIVVGVWSINWFVAREKESLFPIDGNAFNFSSSVFAAFAVIGVALGVWYQHRQLVEAREELQKQSSQIDRQNFEATFFHLVETYSAVVRNLTKHEGSFRPPTEGQAAISSYVRSIDDLFMSKDNSDRRNSKEGLKLFRECYSTFYNTNDGKTGSYFRTIHTILRLLEKADMQDDRDYAKILRAQLTDTEATFLALNFMSNHTTTRFNPLVVKYHMLKNANIEISDTLAFLFEYIPAEAMGSRKAHEKRNITPIEMPPPDNDEYNQY